MRPPRAVPKGAGVLGESAAVRETTRLAGWALGLEVGLAGIGALLAEHRAGSLAVQAFLAEWGVGRLGVAWSDPHARPPTARHLLARLAFGAGIGLGAGVLVIAFAALTGAVTLGTVGVNPAGLGLGLFTATLLSVKDELILRGLVLRALRHTLSRPWRIAACGAVAGAARVGLADAAGLPFPSGGASVSVVSAALVGSAFAALWLRERGAFAACGAHAAWTLVTTTVVSGGVWSARWATTAWGGGGSDLDGSPAALVAIVAAVALGTWVSTRAPERTE